MNYLNNKTVRSSNIELLRILAMLMIIGLHYWGAGVSTIAENNSNRLIYNLSESICICGVNLFVIITSWFSVEQNKINFEKIVKLLIEVAFWGIVSLFLGYLMGWQTIDITMMVKVTIPYFWKSRWFVEAYVILIMLIPFINAGLRTINKSQHGFLLAITFSLFILWPSFLPNPPIDDFGYGFVHFISLYILVSYIKRFLNRLPSKLICLIFFCASVVLVFWQSWYNIATCWMYNNIFVVLEAVFLFLFFVQLNVKSQSINTLASVSFGVFLIHSDRLFFGKLIYENIFHADFYAQGPMIKLIINFILCLPIFYFGCFMLESIRIIFFKYTIYRMLKNIRLLKTITIFEK